MLVSHLYQTNYKYYGFNWKPHQENFIHFLAPSSKFNNHHIIGSIFKYIYPITRKHIYWPSRFRTHHSDQISCNQWKSIDTETELFGIYNFTTHLHFPLHTQFSLNDGFTQLGTRFASGRRSIMYIPSTRRRPFS